METKSWGALPDVSFFGKFVLIFLLIVGLSAVARAQSTATLKGTVTDASGSAVPNAKVSVKNQNTGVEWNAQSDSDGNYLVASLPVGTYRISVTAEGFQTSIANGLKLDVSTTVVQNFGLKVGEVSQAVTVTAEAPVIDSSTITMGQVIDQKTVQEIPLNGRHFESRATSIKGSMAAFAHFQRFQRRARLIPAPSWGTSLKSTAAELQITTLCG